MKPYLFFFTLFVFLFSASIAKDNETLHFVTDLTLSPDENRVVFTYENDLWSANTITGESYRLTGMEGVESHPRFSPDGEWLAFSATQNGNADIFLMPMDGGKIKQLTWHDADDYVESWSWDSQQIYFTSERYNQFTSFKISAGGGTPVRLFPNYFNMPHHIVEHPVTGDLYFTESWESYMFPQRKHYKGAHNPDIKSYNPEKETFKKHTDYEGKDFWPTIDKEGNVYFVSDEWNDEYNLYTFRDGRKVRLTEFESSISRPQVSANGENIVFCKGYQPYVYNIVKDSSKPLPVSLYPFDMLKTQKDFQTSGELTDFDVSPDNKKLAFVSRGRLFVSDVKGQFIRELETDTKERVTEVLWMNDSKSLVYARTEKGWTNLYTISAEGSSQERRLTHKDKTHRRLAMDNERTKLLYIQGGSKLMMMNLEDFSIKTLAEDEFWFRGSEPRFSPEGKYVVYTAYRNFEEDIFIYDLEDGNHYNLTQSGVTEGQPYWSPDGKYIYFASDRFQPTFPRGRDNSNLYRIPLYKFKSDFKSDKYTELFEDKEKKDTLIPEVKFDFDRLKERWEELEAGKGQQYNPYVFYIRDKTVVLYSSDHDGEWGLWKMELEPFEKPENKKLGEHAFGKIVRAKKSYYTLSGGDLYKIELKKNKLEKINIKHTFSKKLHNEFVQMFYENWTILKEYFYDKDFHGIDWNRIKEKYEKFLPYVQTRENLRTLFNDMLGELNSSHLGFYSSGKEEDTYYSLHTAASGIVFGQENPYSVERIAAQSPLDVTDNELQPGDKLVAVNGEAVDANQNRESYFSFPEMPEELTLTFERNGRTYETKVHPVSSGKFKSLLYDEWIAERQEIVDEKTNKKVAYVYMKDMGTSSLEEFLIDMTTETVHRDALILDLRYNRGGNVHDDVLQFLSQRPYLKWKARGGKMSPQPNFAPSGKPVVLLVNEHSLSDAEMTAAGFKELELGTVIGTETYRWLIFTSGQRLVDGSYTRLPTWGCYTLDGEDLEMTGVKPDVYVKNTFKDRLEEKDPQLQKAIEMVLEKLEE